MGVAPARGAFVNVNEGGTSMGFGFNTISRIDVSSVRDFTMDFLTFVGIWKYLFQYGILIF